MTSYRIMLCCNDDRGNPTGRVEEIQIGDEIKLVHPGRGITLHHQGTSTKIGRISYDSRNPATWVGNVFWDAVTMDADVAHILAQNLISSGWVIEEMAEDGPFAKLARSAL